MNAVPLRRNRDFVLLQAGTLLSSFGTQSTQIAYPLLTLALTHSAAKAGIVTFARAVALWLFVLPAGLAADRFSRKRLLIASDVVRAAAVGALAATVAMGDATFWAVALIAFVEGLGAALYSAPTNAVIRAVVPRHQLPTATSVLTGRVAVTRLVGPPLGGALFGVARALPFIADAVSYVFSTIALLAMRTPFEEEREPESARLVAQLSEGIRFMWNRPFLRTLAFIFALANFIFPGVTLALVVIGRRQGLTGGEIGGLVAAFGICLFIGSFLASFVRRLLPTRALIVLELWTWVGCVAFVAWPSVYVLAAGILPSALAIPTTDSVVYPYMLALTPDRLIGRSQAAQSAVSLGLAALGPLAAGFLLANVSARATIAVFAAFGLTLAVWGTLSPAIRAAPSLEDL